MKRILMIDNYDSFTYNLVHYLEMLDCNVTVWRNDKFELNAVDEFDKIVLSPGPGIPDESRLLKPVIEKYAMTKSILGVCLGHQAIAEVFGGKIINLDKVHHGVDSPIKLLVDNDVLYKKLKEPIVVGRYHSWVVDTASLPDELEVTAVDADNHIMSIRHRQYNVRGVQFHPESILTPQGIEILQNWLNIS